MTGRTDEKTRQVCPRSGSVRISPSGTAPVNRWGDGWPRLSDQMEPGATRTRRPARAVTMLLTQPAFVSTYRAYSYGTAPALRL
jgi:hypothetical protein